MKKKEENKENKKEEGWKFIIHFGNGEVWGKDKERILYDPNDDRILHQWNEDD